MPAAKETNMLPATFSCPRCRCHALYRTRRRGLDWLMSVVGLKPVRCFTCDKRFYMRHSRLSDLNQDHPDDEYFRGGPHKVA
jgi:transcription elongation factor Elf1